MKQRTQVSTNQQTQTERLASILVQQASHLPTSEAEWKLLIDLAVHHRVLGLLFDAVGRDAIPTSIIDDITSYLRQQAIPHLEKQRLIKQINQQLNDVNIPVMWLKGAAIGHTLYDDASRRLMSDIDLLVPYEQRRQALSVLKANGFVMRRYRLNNYVLSLDETDQYSHHYELYTTSSPITRVELHYDLFKRRATQGTLAQLDWFWQHSDTIKTNVGMLCVMRPEALLLYLAAHDILQHDMADIGAESYSGIRLLRKYDVYLLLISFPLNWELVMAKASELDWEFAVKESLRQVTHYFDVNLPKHVETWIIQRETNQKLSHDEKKATVALRQLRANLSWRVRMVMVWHILFPLPDDMRRIYNLSDDAMIWHYYLYRFVKKFFVLLRLVWRTGQR